MSADTRKAWLLTWNPDRSLSQYLETAEGPACFRGSSSGMAKLGDEVFLVRVGKEPKGIVLRGRVVKEPYKGKHWEDPDKEGTYIWFEVIEERRMTCSEGLLPLILLRAALPDQNWTPQGSGVGIKSEVLEELISIWDAGQGQHSLRQFVQWYDVGSRHPERLPKYQEVVNLAESIRNGSEELSDDHLQKLWLAANNGIANVANGVISNDEYKNIKSMLEELTPIILRSPTSETGRMVLERWGEAKNGSKIKSIHKAVIHRVFSAAAPDQYTTIVSSRRCSDLLKLFDKSFQLENNHGGDWFARNDEIMRCCKEAGLDSDQILQNNLAMWHLFRVSENGGKLKDHDAKAEETKLESHNAQAGEANHMLNQILYGPPGTGKTYLTADIALKIVDPDFALSGADRSAVMSRYNELQDDERIFFVTFHNSFSYEDFVEGIKAQVEDDKIIYSVERGIFRLACDAADAAAKTDGNVVLIIDEINRGSTSSIFGDLITLIEPSKRIGGTDQRKAILPYSKDEFGVPSNLYIVGTMNTADRSLALFDTALRRRFDFEDMRPDLSQLEGCLVSGINIKDMLGKMNKRIETIYDRDHVIGHAYFMQLMGVSDDGKRFTELRGIFQNRIIPLLEEYFFEDWEKIRRVLGDDKKKSDEHRFIVKSLVGDSSETDSDDNDVIYEKNMESLNKPQSYMSIYEQT